MAKRYYRANEGYIWVRDDSYTLGAPLALTADVAEVYDFSIDFEFNEYAPNGIKIYKWLDEATSKITPDELGSSYIVRLKLVAKPALNNRNFTIYLAVNGSNIYENTRRLARGAGAEQVLTETMWIFAGQGFIDNGATINFLCDGDADLYNFNIGIEKL